MVISQAPKVINTGETVPLELNIAVPLSGSINADVTITSDALYPVQWINVRGEVETSSPLITVETAVPKDDDFKITVKIKSQAIGAIDEAIFIRKARGDGKDVKIPITGTVVGPLRATPDTIFLVMMKAAAPATREIHVSRNDGKPFEIKQVYCPQGVSAEFTASPEGKNVWIVKLQIPAHTPPATLQGDVVVQTTVDADSLKIPFFAVVQ